MPNPLTDEDLKRSGVYSITNTVNGKRYIGSTSRRIITRWNDHRRALRNNRHHSILLQRAWNKYGEEAFWFEVMEFCEPSRCVEREQWFIDQFLSADPESGYNICPKAFSMLGMKHTPESLEKMSAWQQGKKLTKEHRDKIKTSMSNPAVRFRLREKRRQRITTNETKEKMRIAHTGIKHTFATLAKMRKSRAQRVTPVPQKDPLTGQFIKRLA